MRLLVLGIAVVLVACGIAAGAVVVVGQRGEGPPEETYMPRIKAREEWTPKTPPGAPAAALTLPIAYGRFHIVAPETFPGPYAPFPTPLPGVEAVGREVKESATLDEFRDHDLFFEPPYIPAGWELTEAHAETVIWDDGSSWDSVFALQYDRPQYFYIRIQRFLVGSDGRVRLVANPAAEVLYTLGEIRGVPVVYHRDPLQIHFVQGNVLTQIEAPVFDLDELIKIADALIAQTEEAKQPAAAPPAGHSSPVPSATAVAAQSASPTPSPVATQAGPSPPPNARYIPPSELWPAVDYTEDGWPIVADELIVKFRDGVSEDEKEAILSEVGAQSKNIYEYSDIRVVKVDPAQREQVLEELSSNEKIEIVEPNPIAEPDISQ